MCVCVCVFPRTIRNQCVFNYCFFEIFCVLNSPLTSAVAMVFHNHLCLHFSAVLLFAVPI